MSSPLVVSYSNSLVAPNKQVQPAAAAAAEELPKLLQQLEHLPNNSGLSAAMIASKLSGPSSASSTSGYDDSSDGEDNHLINHTHHHHRRTTIIAAATAQKVNDRCDNNYSNNLVRDMHLDREQVVGIHERDPHQQQLQPYNLLPYNNNNNHHHHHHHQHQLATSDSSSKQQQQQLHDSIFTQVRPLGLSSLPIDDFDYFEESYKYSDGEKQLRIKMCAVYRLIEIYGWSMGIYNHVTAKVKGDHEHLLIHPFGLHYNEITASSMLKIDLAGNIVDNGSTNFELNRPGYLVHSAIHMARPDVGAVIHLHYPPVAAASAFKYGLLPICQEQALLGEVRYLDYSGILTDEDEREAVATGLGDSCKVMILRNHGLIVCGANIEEAFYLLSNLMKACETQARLSALGGMDSIIFMSPDAAQQAYETVQNSRYAVKVYKSDKRQTQLVGHINMFELDFEAQMRALDHAGHRTGYHYKRPLVRRTRYNKRW